MKRIVIDADLCQGTGECAVIAPDVVSFDAVGIAHTVADRELVDDLVADRLAATCPSMAITVVPT